MRCPGLILILVISAANAALHAVEIDERGNVKAPKPSEAKFFAGVEAAVTAHSEEGLDRSKGEYSVSYSTFGGSITAQYHFPDFYFEAGVGMMRLLSLTVNDVKINMSNRTQWHLPFYGRAYYKVAPPFAVGAGMTHLTELSMYVDSEKVPDSSFNQIFVDLAAQLMPELTSELRLTLTAMVGLNVLPGRQHIYSVGDLLHMRFQFNAGLLYRVW